MNETVIVYNSSAPRTVGIGLCFVLLGALSYFPMSSYFVSCFAGQYCYPGMVIIFPVCFLWFFLGLVAIMQAIKQLPRLTLSADGVVYQTLFRTRQVSWENLGPFQRVVPGKGMLRAVVTEPLAPGALAKPLVITPFNFGKKIGFEHELNECRRRLTPQGALLQLGAESVPEPEPVSGQLPIKQVLWRSFILFVLQWLVLFFVSGLFAILGVVMADPVKTCIVLFFWGYFCGYIIKAQKVRPNRAAATLGMGTFVASVVPIMGLHLGGRFGFNTILGMDVLCIPFGLCLGLAIRRR